MRKGRKWWLLDKCTAQIFMTDLLHHETKDSKIIFSSPGWFFLSVFSLCGENKNEGRGENQGFQGAFCLTKPVSQKLVMALNYVIVTCSLILHVCHVWHSIKPQIWEKCYSFSIVFRYRKVDMWFLAIGGYIVPVRTDSIQCEHPAASFSPSYK